MADATNAAPVCPFQRQSQRATLPLRFAHGPVPMPLDYRASTMVESGNRRGQRAMRARGLCNKQALIQVLDEALLIASGRLGTVVSPASHFVTNRTAE